MHYVRWKKHGDPLVVLRNGKQGTPFDLFWEKVEVTEGCWLWTGAISKGYGYFKVNGRHVPLPAVAISTPPFALMRTTVHHGQRPRSTHGCQRQEICENNY